MDTKQSPTNLEFYYYFFFGGGVGGGGVNYLIVFPTHFNPNNSLLKLLQISLLFMFTFALRTFAPIVSAHPYCARLRAQIHMPRHASSARAKY